MHRFGIRVAGLAVLMVLALASTAMAAAGGAGTETLGEKLTEFPLIDKVTTNPCTGEEGTLLALGNGKIHFTMQADGNFWVTGTLSGPVTFTPLNPEGTFYSGHFTTWFGEALNNKNSVGHETGSFELTGTDGSKVDVHTRSHISTNAKGEITVETQVKEAHCVA